MAEYIGVANGYWCVIYSSCSWKGSDCSYSRKLWCLSSSADKTRFEFGLKLIYSLVPFGQTYLFLVKGWSSFSLDWAILKSKDKNLWQGWRRTRSNLRLIGQNLRCLVRFLCKLLAIQYRKKSFLYDTKRNLSSKKFVLCRDSTAFVPKTIFCVAV